MRTYFKHGVLEVTDQFIRARGRSIQLSTVESVDLSRNVLFIGLGFFGALGFFGLVFIDLLYFHEIALSVALAGVGIWGATRLGTLSVFTKLTGSSGWPIMGPIKVMQEMRDAIELAISDRDRTRKMRSGGAVNTADNQDDQEAEEVGE
jgi:hypothetical protein